MGTRKVILPTVILVFAMMLSISLVSAATATAATLHTTDALGNDKVLFGAGEEIHVRWTADGTVNIKAEFEDGTIDGSWLSQPKTGEIIYSPSKGTGYYVIYCSGSAARLVAYGTFFVVPEVPLGAIMATIASFGALSVFGTVKLRHARAARATKD